MIRSIVKARMLSLAAVAGVTGCATYHDVEEIKMVGFSQDVSRGQSTGQFAADDCVFQIAGYWLGGHPDVSKAIANARSGKQSKVTDVVGMDNAGTGQIRYATNLSAKPGGFNAYIFGKHCIEVKGMGYK